MSYTLVLNSNNVIGSNNNTYQYNFIQGGFKVKEGYELAIGSLTIPYSWFNITTLYQNNSFQLQFPYNGGIYDMNIVLPDGFYTVNDIQNYIELQCINNGLYLIYNGQYVYYFDITYNENYYACQINMTVIPTSVPAGYSQPATGYWSTSFGLPTIAATTGTFNTGTIGTIIGAPANTTIGPSGSNISFLSTSTPQGSPVNSLIMTCNLISNDVTSPSNIIDTIPINNTFGSNIIYNPTFPKWVKIRDGTYSEMTITFCDQNFKTVFMNDPNLCLSLLIRKKD